ncbi:energy transducer TonB [Lysobacter sp. LF1]|uniref:Energy transducer TonB n=1 Tax=Lysobacter stagni TaxID=3045172 RepID=A0ABT6XE72_9GAMM|nr:energy transducer TonB [Lysobacter sp. LF1]MDI9238427.1 energy transducer TonB [Lysobacter sp. LF1]
MDHRLRCGAVALLLAACLPTTAAEPAVAPVPTATPAKATGNARFVVTRVPVAPGELDRLFARQLSHTNVGRMDPVVAMNIGIREFTDTEGKDAGAWRFHRDMGKPPRINRATRTVVRTTPDQYDVERFVYCDDDASVCDAFIAAETELRIPAPAHRDGMSNARLQWMELLGQSQCHERPVDMGAPKYPPMAARTGVGGTLRLALVIDPCGNVQDEWIHTSSQSRELDRAALERASGWNVGMQPERGTAQTATVPISFTPPPTSP